jgi:hypothetical protein
MKIVHEQINQSNETAQGNHNLARAGKFLTKATAAVTLPLIPAVMTAEAPSAAAAEVVTNNSVSNQFLENLQNGHPRVAVDLQTQYQKGTKVYKSPTTNGGKKNILLTVAEGQAFSTQGLVVMNGWQPVSFDNKIVYVQFHDNDIMKNEFTKAQEASDAKEHAKITIEGSNIVANYELQEGLVSAQSHATHTPTSTGGLYNLG